MRPALSVALSFVCLVGVALAATPGASHPLSVGERAELLPVICGGAVSGRGCAVCPPGSSAAGEAGPLEATAVTYGRFLSAQQTTALVDLSGCEAHVTNFGASALLRWEGLTRWTLVQYLPGYRSSQCAVFAGRDGRDRSVCEGYYANMGTELSSLGLTDWTRPDRTTTLLSLESNVQSCFGAEVHDLRLANWSQQGSTLVARVSEARVQLSKDRACGDPVKLPPARTYSLTWLWTGAALVPDAATKKLLPRLQNQP